MLLNYCSKLLQKQCNKTGVAILAPPSPSLPNDLKFPGQVKQDCIKVCEKLALTSLAAELLVLDTCEVPGEMQSKYSGRAQYPKFKTKTLSDTRNISEYKSDLLFWWGGGGN